MPPSDMVPVPDLLSLFGALEQPLAPSDRGEIFAACPIPGIAHHRIAKDNSGQPVGLIATPNLASPLPPPIQLQHLAIQHDLACAIAHADGSIEHGRFTIIRCVGGDRTVHQYFLRVLGTVIATIGTRPSPVAVTEAIGRLAELFHAMSQPPHKTVQGMWAELALIAESSDPAALIRAWHATPEDIFDFNAGFQRMEVKSASGRVRRHHFTLSQLSPPVNTRLLIASLLIERAGAGDSLENLITVICERLADNRELIMKLNHVVVQALGNTWRETLTACFDRQLARHSLTFFDSSVIPRVSPDIPPGVSDVRFTSDLSACPTMSAQDCRAAGGLFKAAMPHRP